MSKIPAVDLNKLETSFAQLERLGVPYKLGGKAPMGTSPAKIKGIDCSGYVRWALDDATDGELTIPDGSQNQRAYFEKLAEDPASGVRKVDYRDAARYINEKRLFIAFIKPFTNGCGPVGHVWLLSQYDDGNNGTKAGTLESHGGVGINSRAWNSRTLLREVFSCYEIPAK